MISICKDFGKEKAADACGRKGFCLNYRWKNGKVVAKLIFFLQGFVVLSFFNIFFANSFHFLFIFVG